MYMDLKGMDGMVGKEDTHAGLRWLLFYFFTSRLYLLLNACYFHANEKLVDILSSILKH